MSFYNYTRDIPHAPDNPSEDQPDMEINNNSNQDIWDEDHYGFNNNAGGFHKYSSYLNLSPADPGVGTADGRLYCRNNLPVWVNSTNVIPLVAGNPSPVAAGYTYLPGGLIMQWGRTPANTLTTNVFFPIPMQALSTPFSIVLTMERSSGSGSADSIYINPGSPSSVGFQMIRTFSSTLTINWIAIGLA